jgi:hypothetical protein
MRKGVKMVKDVKVRTVAGGLQPAGDVRPLLHFPCTLRSCLFVSALAIEILIALGTNASRNAGSLPSSVSIDVTTAR